MGSKARWETLVLYNKSVERFVSNKKRPAKYYGRSFKL